MCAYAGTATLVGMPVPGAKLKVDLEADFFDPRITLAVTHGGDTIPQEDFPFLAQAALDGRIDLARFVTSTISLDEVPERCRGSARAARSGRSRCSSPRRDRIEVDGTAGCREARRSCATAWSHSVAPPSSTAARERREDAVIPILHDRGNRPRKHDRGDSQ